MQKIRVGVAGAGHLGYHHARNYALLPDVTLAGVADIQEEKRAKAADDFKAPGVPDIQSLLALGVDAVSVATPSTTHCDVVMELLEAGVHILVEKPMAPTLAEAERMVAAAREKNLVLQVGHIERFNGAVMAVMESFSKPKFIECHRLSPYPMRGADVSVVLDLMIHDLDIVLAMEPGKIEWLDAAGTPIFSESEDIANVRIRFASGCVANITSSRVSVDRMRKIRIFAENAYVATDYSAQEVLVYRKKPGPIPPGENPMEHISIEPLAVRKEEPLKLELESFVNCVREGLRPVVSGEDGLKAVRLAEQIQAYIREHL
ncbi:MAG TPA: Gfo/Idh/MocA family oxidoreductase [Candidatus Hydrogenedentes bacterium]|nr:Gfo/Idh/MocA family oxidoreductase [Candidatus Hydrogenedentota bacterium]